MLPMTWSYFMKRQWLCAPIGVCKEKTKKHVFMFSRGGHFNQEYNLSALFYCTAFYASLIPVIRKNASY